MVQVNVSLHVPQITSRMHVPQIPSQLSFHQNWSYVPPLLPYIHHSHENPIL